MDVPCSQVVEMLGFFSSALSGLVWFGFWFPLSRVFPAVAWFSVLLIVSLGVSSGSGTIEDSTS